MSAADPLPAADRADGLDGLRQFVRGVALLVDAGADEGRLLQEGAALLRSLIAHDDWLPQAYAVPDPARYRQYLLYRDPEARFSIVSFVWAPGQHTPVHDHTVWGLVGVLRGAEAVETYALGPGGLVPTGRERLAAGAVDTLSPSAGDIHRVANAVDDVTVSIHVYGADIGAVSRSTYADDGSPRHFVSAYADAPPLTLWNH